MNKIYFIQIFTFRNKTTFSLHKRTHTNRQNILFKTTIYYPGYINVVRLRKSFYLLYEYLANAFTGEKNHITIIKINSSNKKTYKLR